MPENLLVAVRFAFDLFLKATLLLAMTVAALFLLRRASAAVRQLVATLGLAGALALPVVSLLAPRWEIPLVPNPLPAAAATPVDSEPFVPATAPDFTVERETSKERAPVNKQGTSGWTPATASAPDPGTAAPIAKKDFEPGGTAPKASSPPTWWMLGTLALWSAGALFAVFRLLLGARRVAWIRRQASGEADGEWTALSAELAEKLGLARPARLLFSADLAVPVTAGLRHPIVLLPDGARRWGEERRRVVLLHELAHVRRGDWLALMIAQAAAALYWFHPLAWSARIQMQTDCERACDDLVLAAGTRPSVYAAHLLSIIRSLRLSRQRALPAVAMARRSYWDGRMRAILDPGVARNVVTGRETKVAAAAIFSAVAALAVFEPWAPPCAAAAVSNSTPRAVDLKSTAERRDSQCPKGTPGAKRAVRREKKTKEPSLFVSDR